MKSPQEKKLVDGIQEMLVQQARNQIEALGVESTPELEAQMVGSSIANLDGLFAIRDGESWRGLSDPREIA